MEAWTTKTELAAQRKAIREARSVWGTINTLDDTFEVKLRKSDALDAVKAGYWTVVVETDGTVTLEGRGYIHDEAVAVR